MTLDVVDLSSDCSSNFASSERLFEVEELQDELCSSSPSHPSSPSHDSHQSSPVMITTPMKGGLHSYFPTVPAKVYTGKRPHPESGQPLQPPPKRVHTQPSPATPSVSDSAAQTQDAQAQRNLGRSAVNKLALNKAVEAGTFKHDERKWAAFKSKIVAIDPQSEVDDVNPRCARDVLHVRCGKLLRMATVYDTTLYKRHVQNCKSRTAKAGMHTLDKGLNYVFLRQSGPSSVSSGDSNGSELGSEPLWPCPGLSEEDDPRIEQYLLRTTVSSAGGISIETQSEQMYNSPYRNLTADQKQAVRAGQVHTHRWSLDHQRRRIFAIGEKPCVQKVPCNSGKHQPCCACKALLRNRAFLTAINRDVPDDVNRKFTPLLYQASEIAKICAKHSGLGSIFDKVKYN
jgi:hypothetical protein